MAGIDNVLKYLLELDASGVVNGSKAAGDAIQAFFDKVNTRKPPSAGGGGVPGLPSPEQTKKHVAGVVGGLEEAEHAVDGFMSSLQGGGSLSGLLNGLMGIGAAAAPLLAVAAAGMAVYESIHLIGESVNEAVKWNLEAGKLARQLGITTQEASVLGNVLEDNGISTQTYVAAVNFMTRALANGSPAFAQLGVATKNADGSLRPINQTFTDVIDKLRAMPDEASRAVLGQQLLGRAWKESQELLRINSETLRENADQMATLGTVVTPSSEAAARKYSLAVAEVHDVINAFGINLGNTFIPALTVLAHWFAEEGTHGVVSFRGALDGVKVVLDEMVRTFEIITTDSAAFKQAMSEHAETASIWQKIGSTIKEWVLDKFDEWLIKLLSAKTAIEDLADKASHAFQSVGAQLKGVFTGDWDKDAVQKELDYQARSKARWEEFARKRNEILNKPGPNDAVREPDIAFPKSVYETKNKAPPTKNEAKDWMDAQKAALADAKVNDDTFRFGEISAELAFWDNKLAIAKSRGPAYKNAVTQIQKEIDKLLLDAKKEEQKAELQALKDEGADRDKAFEKDIAARRQHNQDRMAAVKNTSELDEEKTAGKFEVASIGANEGQKNELALAAVKAKLAAEQEAADKIAAIRKKDVKDFIEGERAKLNAAILVLEAQRSAVAGNAEKSAEFKNQERKLQDAFDKLEASERRKEDEAEIKDTQNKLKREEKLELETKKKIAKDRAELSKEIQGYMEPLVSGFSNGIKKILDGTLSFGDAMKGLGKMILSAFGDIISMILTSWIKMLAEMIANWIASLVIKETTEKGSDATRIATGIAMRTQEGIGGAAVAAINAAASAAAIPVIGWAMAPGVAAATFGALSTFIGLASAAGGFDIPSGLNPVTQLHAQEMVLPAHLANAVRDMAKGGGGGGGPTVVNIQALDGPGVGRVLRGNERQVAKVFRELARDGKGRRR